MPLGHAKPAADTNIPPVSSTAPTIATSTKTVISHRDVSTAGDLLLPSPSATLVTAGACEIVTVVTPSTTTTGGSPVNGDGSIASAGFTRVAISFDDDDDDDEEEEET